MPTCVPYMPTLHTYPTPTKLQNLTHTYPTPTYLHYTYNLHDSYSSYDTTHLCSTQRIGPAPAHLLNEHVVDQCGCYVLVIRYYVLRHLLAMLLLLKLVRVSCRRKEY